MLKSFFYTLLLLDLFVFSSCTIYQSPERKSFESESPTFKIQSLQKAFCTEKSIRPEASQSRLISIQNDTSLWEHIINNKSFYETDLNNQEYCIYEIKN